MNKKCVYNELQEPPSILFVELEPWEQEELSILCPGKCTIRFSPDLIEAIGKD